MSEELRISEILIKKFDETQRDITDIKVGMGALTTLVKSAIETQQSHSRRLDIIDTDRNKMKGVMGVMYFLGVTGLIAFIKEAFHL